jgi:hypothetical protein
LIYIYYLNKGKAGGKGPKTISPILDGPNESDTSRPLDSEEIQALAIRLDELEKVKFQSKSFEENFFSSVSSRKKIN